MKAFIKNNILFILFLSFFYSVIIVAWGGGAPSFLRPNLYFPIGSYGHLYSRINEIKTVKDVDIVFLGSSHSYRGFDPRIFSEYGYKTFNLGSSAQTPIQTNILLERYLDILKPKTIIYEVFPSTFTGDGVESSLDLIANDKIDFKLLKMAIILNNIKTYNTFIYGLFMQIFNTNKDFKENAVKNDDIYISGGFVEKKLSYNKSIKPEKRGINKWIPINYQIQAFENSIKLIRNNNIELILVQSPVTSVVFDKYDNNDLIDAYFSEKVQNYYNFNKIIRLNDSLHFADRDHLNQMGVRRFNEALIEKIKNKN